MQLYLSGFGLWDLILGGPKCPLALGFGGLRFRVLGCRRGTACRKLVDFQQQGGDLEEEMEVSFQVTSWERDVFREKDVWCSGWLNGFYKLQP